METKLIKGQAYLSGLALVQDSIMMFTLDGKTVSSSEATVALINNIWEDLINPASLVKTNGKGFWYWEYKMTDMETEREVDIFYECPTPSPELFLSKETGLYDFKVSKKDSDWVAYWKRKLKEVYK